MPCYMKVLLVNKFYYPKGGADIHVLRLEELLTSAGHEVAIFAMTHPENKPSKWSPYFVSQVDFSHVTFSWPGLRAAGRAIWSFEAARKMKKLLRDFQPDVVHLHNIYHQISPSILPVLKKSGVRVVQTLHDYALLSPNYTLSGHGGVCEHGRDGKWYEILFHRCIKGSFAASLLDTVAMYIQRGSALYLSTVHQFISPSAFLKKFSQDWFHRELPITVLPNFTEAQPVSVPRKKHVVYVGRLSAEKGVDHFIRALALTQVPASIVGDGPERKKLEALAAKLRISNLTFLGNVPPEQIPLILAEARALVVPSQWYENYPLVILESFVQGTPVIGSRMGGIPELVQDGISGWTYEATDEAALQSLLIKSQKEPEAFSALADGCRTIAAEHTPGGYLKKLEEVYAPTE